MMVSKGNHPNMALIQVSEILFHLPRYYHYQPFLQSGMMNLGGIQRLSRRMILYA